MGLELIKQVYQKPPSDPILSWVFRVAFFNVDNAASVIELNKEGIAYIPIKVDLPSFDTHIVTQKFFGTEKSFPIIRKHGGDTTLEFNAYSEATDNELILNFLKEWKDNNLKGPYYRKEFKTIFNKIEVSLYDRTDKQIYKYHFINCIPTKFDEGSLGYETEDKIRFTLSVHYDDWYVEIIKDEDEEQ